MPADVDAIEAVCEPRGVAVIEDAACAIGSTYRGRPVGAGGNLVALSFHPRKLLTTGEGGMLLTPRRRRSPGGCGACASTGWRVIAHDRHASAVRRASRRTTSSASTSG